MPRHPGHFPADLANLKENATDIIYDFEKIAAFLAEYHKDYINSSHIVEFKNLSKKCAKLKPSKPAYSNRIYVTTNFKYISLMVVNLDEPVLDNLKYTCELVEREEEYYDGDYYGVLWVFEGSDLTFKAFVSAKMVGKLVGVFHKENLVNYGSFRDDWIAKPRRNARHSMGT